MTEPKESPLISSESWTSSELSSLLDEEKIETCRSPRRNSRLDDPKLTPFKLRWSYGLNPRVPVVNLTSEDRTLIAHACSHATALYDYASRDMHLLQGHKNYVSTISTDFEGKWLLTADSGKDSVVVVWDTETRVPIRTLFNPHGAEELLTAKLSPDAKYIVTASNEIEITINFWLWTYGRDEPDATAILTGLGSDRIKDIVFNSDAPNQFLLGYESNVVFVTWENASLNWRKAKINGDVERFGVLNVSSYILNTRQALTGTSNGHVLVWGDALYEECFSVKRAVSNAKNHVKSLRLETCSITAIANHENTLVIGNALGHINFYDSQLRLIFCCQKFGLDKITSISFDLDSHRKAPARVFSESFAGSSTSTLDYTEIPDGNSEYDDRNGRPSRGRSDDVPVQPENLSNLSSNVTIALDLTPPVEPAKDQQDHKMGQVHREGPSDYTLHRSPFLIKDFIVSTGTSRIARIEISHLKCRYIMNEPETAVTAADTHPDRDLLVTGDTAGRVRLYNYVDHRLLISKKTPPLPSFEELIAHDVTGSITNHVTCPKSHESLIGVTSLKFSPNGRELACGMQSGALWILHPDILDPQDQVPFKHSSISLLDIVFSEKSDYMAYRDDNATTGAYRYTEPDKDDDSIGGWHFLGKYHAHSLPIREILFGPPLSGGSAPRFFTLSEDRCLIEYDLENSGSYPEPGLKIFKIIPVERSAIPLCMAWYPKFEVERFFVFSNTEYKFKLLNDCTKLIQGTYLGPTFGTPANRITFLPMRNQHNQAYMVFSTDTQIGLQLLPFEGNPFMIAGIVAHPQMIIRICLSRCGGFLFTLGYNDPCVLMWKINPRVVDVMAQLGGCSLSPFYGLLDGGQDGWLLREMQDLFYYAQILHQGENTTVARTVSDKVSVTQLPNLMRAVGYYPSASELEELMNEVVSTNYAKTGQLVEEITFEEFVKLYVNHRPVFGVSMEQVRRAFAAFGDSETETDPRITGEEFLRILTEEGDRMSAEQARETVNLLMPVVGESGKSSPDTELFSSLPTDISYKDFALEILGIESMDETDAASPDKDAY